MTEFTPHKIITGLWQVSGTHGDIDPKKAVEDLIEYSKKGFHCFDMADHYGPAEEFVGEMKEFLKFRNIGSPIQVYTKWVPTDPKTRWTLDVDYSLKFVEQNIDLSLKRTSSDSLDLLQFHWWDYEDDRLFHALDHLYTLKEKGKIEHIGLTNFSTKKLIEIVQRGYPISSHQVRFSLTDYRANHEMLQVCEQRNIKILAFGTLAAGFLSDKYIETPFPEKKDLTRGQVIHSQLINNIGGESFFQQLLEKLKSIGEKHSKSISNVASKFILQKSPNISVVIGARLGVSEHRSDNLNLSLFELDEEDISKIENHLSKGRDLLETIGPIGSEYRGAKIEELQPI